MSAKQGAGRGALQDGQAAWEAGRTRPHLVASVLERPQRVGRVHRLVAAIDLLEDGIVSVLHAQLDARASIPSQPTQLGGIDGVGSGLECEAYDLTGRPLVQVLLLGK